MVDNWKLAIYLARIMLSRRHFLKGSSLAALSLTGIPQVAQPADRFYKGNYQKPRHIIHMVADGMSMGTLTGGHHFSNLLRQRGLTWIELISRPTTHNGLMDMRSLNSLVTDSAAASSSWGSGTRIINGKLNQMSDGSPLKTIYELFGEAGWKRGLVTTTEITHATPAGFATSVADRGNGKKD
jgi:alkaline phosphatase